MRHTRAALAALAVAAIMLTGCKAEGNKSAPTQPAAAQGAAHGSTTQTTTGTPSTPSSPTTSGSGGGTKQTPPHRPTAAEGVATAVSFMHREIGMTKPVAGKLRWTGGDTAEVDVHPELPGEAEGHQPWRTGPVTVVSLQRLTKVWYVLGTRTSTIKVKEPRSFAHVSSPVEVFGAALAFEGNVQVRVTQDRYGKDILLGSGNVTGGGDVLRPFVGEIAFRRPTARTGSIIFSEPSAVDGTAIAATVVRVRFDLG
jgi:hypothetical protein